MDKLRVYVSPGSAHTNGGQRVFYSRRESGPYYRWRFEEEQGRWHSSRVNPQLPTLKELCLANWKIVPPALQERLDEHYLA
jgi:hypothetical protein